MRTSTQLFDECGNAILDYYSQFDLENAAQGTPTQPVKVVMALVVEGQVIAQNRVDFENFLQIVNQPFSIKTADKVYLNIECGYSDTLKELIQQNSLAHFDVPAEFAFALPHQIDGLGLTLTPKQKARFSLGYPIWRRSALTSTAQKGEDGRSRAASALGAAMRTWSVIGELIIRHALTQVKKDKTAFVHDSRNLSAAAKALIGCALGLRPDQTEFIIRAEELNVHRLSLKSFTYESSHSEARLYNFSGNESEKSCPAESDKAKRKRARRDKIRAQALPLYRDAPNVISASIKREMADFTTIHHPLRFDGFALAAWAAKVLIYLRVAYTATLSVDDERGPARERLIEAHKSKGDAADELAAAERLIRPSIRQHRLAIAESTYSTRIAELAQVANDFAFTPLFALRGERKEAGSGRSEATRIGLDQLLGAQEALVIAMLADIDPRLLTGGSWPPERLAIQIDVFEAARWMGKLYRERRASLNLPQAQRLQRLMTYRAAPDENTLEVQHCVGTMLSFLSCEGLEQLKEGVSAVCCDRLIRTVIATNAIRQPANAQVQVDNSRTRRVFAALRASEAQRAREAKARVEEAKAKAGEAAANGEEARKEAIKNAVEAEAEASSYNIAHVSPIFVSAGYVLIPGDYESAWQNNWRNLLSATETK